MNRSEELWGRTTCPSRLDAFMPNQDSIKGDEDRKTRSVLRHPIFAVAVVVVVAVALIEMFVLQGEMVSRESVSGATSPLVRTLRIDRVDEKHLLEIYTRKKTELKILIQDPKGETIHEIDEMTRHKRRYLTITPQVAGAYKLTIERDALLGSGTIRGRIELLVNDRRVIAPLLYAVGL